MLEAGGNAFYEKRNRKAKQVAESHPLKETVGITTMSYDVDRKEAGAIGTMLAARTRPSAAD